ncbi:MAG: hypothetical protein AB8H79_07595 [Myxococcota bacterium]
MIIVLLTALSVAQDSTSTHTSPVRFDAHGSGLYDITNEQLGAGLGGGIGGGTKPVLFELRLDGQYIPNKPRLLVWPALRVHLLDADRAKAWRPSFVVGAGLEVADPLGPTLAAGIDLDLPGSLRRNPRVGARLTTDVSGNWVAGLNVGMAWRLIKDTPAPPPPPPVEPPPQPPPKVEGPWWDPETCDWVDEDPGYGWSPAYGVGAVIPTGAGGAGPAGTAGTAGTAGGDPGTTDPDADEPTAQGWLMVVGSPGDVVRLKRQDGTPVPDTTLGEDGVARMAAAEGVAEVTIAGGGREQTFEAAIADGYVLWLRAATAAEVSVQFASGSATVNATDRASAQALANNRGAYQLQVAGSYSPEGRLSSNLALARRRAAAVVALLKEAGVPSEDIVILDPAPPRPGLSSAEQRAVYIMPVPRGER